jgi:PncC family amidohydrolase
LELSQELIKRKLTIATAESLTGGLISAALTSVPGSSAYFLAGINAYSNESKINLLGVPGEIIAVKGAVSPECAKAMASGVTRAVGSHIGLSSTGIAGPSGDTPTKPLGLVYVAVFSHLGSEIRENRFTGSRHEVTLDSTEAALTLLLDFLKRND